MSLKIFVLSQHENTGYDVYTASAIIAIDESRARQIADDQYGNEWEDSENVTCREIGQANDDQEEGIFMDEIHNS